jgi:protein-S-isoprenylcysteine O-methyltransferase Ste14
MGWRRRGPRGEINKNNDNKERRWIVSAIPAFEIGVWNAWIFMAYLLLSFVPFIYIAIKKKVPSIKESGLSGAAKVFAGSSKLLLFPAMVYSVFLPMKLGTLWFFVGLPVTLIGLVAYTVVLVNWATAPRESHVSGGLYRYSRHPMYIAIFVFLLGLSIATASWVLLLLFVVFVVGCVVYAGVEEQSCLESYGDNYRQYMARTPRWIGATRA